MAELTADEQAQLEALLAQKAAPPVRTATGVTGILHALIDSASGLVAHRNPEEWEALHGQAESLAGVEDQADDDGAAAAAADDGSHEG